jgi:hypothetical protein
MTVHLFGASSSPGVANFALKAAANLGEEEFGQDVANFVRNNFYVDDGLISVESPKQAEDLIKASKRLCEGVGFRLGKFQSTHPEVLHEENPPGLAEQMSTSTEHGVLRTLGVQWDPESDCFEFNLDLPATSESRRQILSAISSVYDPMGLIAPFTLVAKMCFSHGGTGVVRSAPSALCKYQGA